MISEESGTPVDQMRLIFSGRVLQNDHELEVYKILDNNTVHMVRSAARAAPAASTATNTAAPTTPASSADTNTTTPAPATTAAAATGTSSHPLLLPMQAGDEPVL